MVVSKLLPVCALCAHHLFSRRGAIGNYVAISVYYVTIWVTVAKVVAVRRLGVADAELGAGLGEGEEGIARIATAIAAGPVAATCASSA
jgi:hypothetical protein